MNKYISPQDWIPANKLSFDPVSMGIIKSNNNNLVSAGPGAGKTEMLAQRAAYLLSTNTSAYPRKILALSYKVDAAKNLEVRVRERCGDALSQRFVSKTYDAFAKSLLDQFKNLLQPFYGVADEYKIASVTDIRAAIRAAGYGKESGNRFYYNNYLVENKLPIIDTPYGDIARKVWPILLKGEVSKSLEAKLSFPMIARLAELIVSENQVLKNSLQLTYGHIFLDEFQDTPIHHYDLISTCFNSQQTVVTAVGDKKQRIMLWAGALATVFERFIADFQADERLLMVNHRSAPKLVKLQKPIVEKIVGAQMDIQPSEKWVGNEGVAEQWRFANPQDEADFILGKVKWLIQKDSTALSDICILTRQRASQYAETLINTLKGNGIKARVEDEYQSLLKEEIVLLWISFIQLSQEKAAPDDWLYLTRTLRNLKGYSSRTASNNLYELEESLSKFISDLSQCFGKLKIKAEFDLVLTQILAYLDPGALIGQFPHYNKAYILLKQDQFANLFWKELEACNDWNIAVESFKGDHSIPVMTIHKSKGLEFKTVILLGLEDSAFWNMKENSDEELCTFFVAVSRAIERMYFTYCDEREDTNSSVEIKMFYDLLIASGVVNSYSFVVDFEKLFEIYATSQK